ncbi:MAG: LacI family DNA-binding transcriptional regulator [Clostridia bacterium]|nr:LacI family DNA-binding transcriptional regulator [Clostridia bacterium]
MNTSRVTLKDVAAVCGYTVNTVSRALRGDQRLSEATRERICAVARQMGYAPNQIASSLRSGRTRIFAVILGNMSNPFYGIMTDTIQDAAQQAGYSLMIMCSRDDAALERQLAEQAIARRVDGILLFPTADSQPTVRRLREAGMPFVLMARCLAPGEADSVVCDEARGAYLATMHLVEHGLKRLAYLSGSTVVFSSEQRIKGFLDACADAGIPEADRRVWVLNDQPATNRSLSENVRFLVGHLRKLKAEGFDGLFVFCDVQAWHVLYTLQNAPDIGADDFGIVSFDNIEGALAFPIPLCSIGCDYAEMARQGIELLRARIHGDPRRPHTVVCPVHLICRGSCGRMRQ